jgi:RNA polymerase sigma-70 factor (ECF subfamily)
MLRRFTAALAARDEQALLAIFTPDSVWTADGGGRTAAARAPIVGGPQIVRLVIGLTRTLKDFTMRVGLVNGEPGLHVHVAGRLAAAMAVDLDGDRIAAVYAVVNPDKLTVTDGPSSASTH